MSIVSLVFLGYCLLVVFLYFILPKRIQPYVLLVASVVFYALYSYKAFYYLLFTSLSVFFAAKAVDRLNNEQKNSIDAIETARLKKKQTLIYSLALIANLCVLLFLKFYNFSIQNINLLGRVLGLGFSFRTLKILMPLGISFYTFQAVSYLIDVKRGKYSAEKRYDRLLLTLIYFPQLIQGPINKYDEMAPQLFRHNTFDIDRLLSGAQRIAWGFFKKLVIADRAAVFVNTVFQLGNCHVGLTVFIGVVFYSLQVYADFSGGIDIVNGFSEILGIKMMENFRRPFFAETLSDFWQRWHISLGTWMREYVFYPIAISKRLNRLGKKLRKKGHKKAAKVIPTSLASMVVFFFVGIWHGASWKYVAYGLYNGIIISGGVLLQDYFDVITHKVFKANTEVFSWKLFRILRTFLIVSFGRYLSRANSLSAAILLLKRTFTNYNPWVLFDGSLLKLGLDRSEMKVLFFAVLLLLVVSLYQESGHSVRMWLNRQNLYFRVIVQVLFLLSIAIFGYYGPEFKSANFIYQGF